MGRGPGRHQGKTEGKKHEHDTGRTPVYHRGNTEGKKQEWTSCRPGHHLHTGGRTEAG